MSANDWDAHDAIVSIPLERWRGLVWRMHGVRYEPTSVRGSELSSGRYHRARAQAPTGRVWPALYTAIDMGTSIGEATRNVGSVGTAALKGRRLTELRVELCLMLDLRDLERLGLSLDAMIDDRDYSVPHEPSTTQQLALAALDRGAEGILVPSATLLGANLVILTDNVLSSSRIEVLSFIDPRLHAERD